MPEVSHAHTVRRRRRRADPARRAGWTEATFKTGDEITITVLPAKAGTPVGLINRAQPVLVNGKQVLSGHRTANAID